MSIQSQISAFRGGAVLPVDAGCPWHSRVPAPIPGPVAVSARTAKAATPRVMAAIGRPFAVTAELPLVVNRKQSVHMTRVNAGGDGAMGPHPEREPA